MKNDFEILCNKLKKCNRCRFKNPIVCSKGMIRAYVGQDRNKLLKLKAEAQKGDFIILLNNCVNTMALLISATALALNVLGEKDQLQKALLAIFSLVIVLMIHLASCSFDYINNWRCYVLIAIEEIEKEFE